MGHDALALDRARAIARSVDAAGEIRRNGVAAVPERTARRAGRARRRRRRLEADEHPGNDVAGLIVPGTPAERRRPRLAVPRGDRPAAIDGGALIDHVREAVVFPCHLVLARELDAHRLSDRVRQQRRVVRHGVRPVDAIAARSAHVDDADVVRRDAEHRRDAASRRIRRLRRRPHGRFVPLHISHRARRPHRSMHLIRMQIRRLQHRRGGGHLLIHVLRVDNSRVARRLFAQVVVEIVLRRQTWARGPYDFQLGRRLDRLPLLLAHHADEVLADDHFHQSRHAADRSLVDARDRCADRRRADDAAVQHSWNADVVDELERACRHLRHVDARHRRPHHLPVGDRLARGVRVHGDVEPFAANELAVADAFAGIAFDADNTVARRKPIDRDAEPLGREAQQRFTSCRGGLRQVSLVEVGRRRLAPGRGSLVGTDRRVALNELHPRDRHRQLLGDELNLRRVHALAELALAGIRGDAAVGADGEPRIELRRIDVRPARVERALHDVGGVEDRCGAEAHDERARHLQERTAVDGGGYFRRHARFS